LKQRGHNPSKKTKRGQKAGIHQCHPKVKRGKRGGRLSTQFGRKKEKKGGDGLNPAAHQKSRLWGEPDAVQNKQDWGERTKRQEKTHGEEGKERKVISLGGEVGEGMNILRLPLGGVEGLGFSHNILGSLKTGIYNIQLMPAG